MEREVQHVLIIIQWPFGMILVVGEDQCQVQSEEEHRPLLFLKKHSIFTIFSFCSLPENRKARPESHSSAKESQLVALCYVAQFISSSDLPSNVVGLPCLIKERKPQHFVCSSRWRYLQSQNS